MVRLVIVRVTRQDVLLMSICGSSRQRLLGLRLLGKLPGLCVVLLEAPVRRPLLSKITNSWRAIVGVVALATVTACSDDDPFRPSATVPNVTTGLSLAAFSTGTVAPSAIDLLNLRAVRPEVSVAGQVNFQIAVDLDDAGQIRLLPVLAVLSPPGGANSVGLARSTASFDELARAPSGGFVADSAVTTVVGETWLIQLQAGTCIYSDPLYGKFVVDEVNMATKRVFVRMVLNRNCGYRDLTEGLPRN